MPAPRVTVNDVLQLKVSCWMQDQLGLNVRYWRVRSITGAGPDLQEIADAFGLALPDVLKDCISDDAEYLGLSVKMVGPGPATIAYLSDIGAGAGTVPTGPMPSQVCGMVTLKTDLAGRANRGRIYVPFPARGAADVITGLPTAGYVAAAQEYGDIFANTFNAAGVGSSAVLEPGLSTPIGNPFTLITAALARNRFGTQRRRGQYGAHNPKEIAQ